MSKMWFDDSDNRGCPKGWLRAKDVDEAVEIIKSGEVEEMSLDHDIDGPVYGCYSSRLPDGTTLVYWMLNNLPPMKWPHTIRLHSSNEPARKRMYGLLSQAAPNFVRVIMSNGFSVNMIAELSDREAPSARELITQARETAKAAGADGFGVFNDPEAVEIMENRKKKDE